MADPGADRVGEVEKALVAGKRGQAVVDQAAGTVGVAAAVGEHRLEEGQFRPAELGVGSQPIEKTFVVGVDEPVKQQQMPSGERLCPPVTL